ncbi:Lsr2 family protein [Kitasatospora sp. NPDC048540]|uniref:histone-like nucleoid-structuring protein Lsr2 n=1 Tax=unclassified Kitasatospora TaxID=2633591 RepID=UPI00053B874C|nr:Lsr2 family protein [Kitasatospora sp. MBT63]
MAQRVHVVLEDDLEGGAAAETVHFALDGRSYEIDLNSVNADKLRDALAPFVDSARRQSGRGAGPRRPVRTSKEDTAKIRDWARSNGYDISDRGRVPSNVREAYEQAN